MRSRSSLIRGARSLDGCEGLGSASGLASSGGASRSPGSRRNAEHVTGSSSVSRDSGAHASVSRAFASGIGDSP
jgi:hypothetical protein